jgi:TatD DNase family protein
MSLSEASLDSQMIDSHTHLHSCMPRDAELVQAALDAGVTRMVTVGTGRESNRQALAAAEAFPQVYAAIGHHPNDATGFDDPDLADLRQLAGHERCVAIGETGLDYYRDHAPRPDQERAFLAQIELAGELGKPLVIHTRAADDDTIALLSEHAAKLRVILHCFSMGDRVDECLTHRNWWFSFAGNVTYPSAQPLRDALLRVPAERLLVETDAPYLSPQAVRRERNQPANVVRTAEAMAIERRVSYAELERSIDAAAADLFGW